MRTTERDGAAIIEMPLKARTEDESARAMVSGCERDAGTLL